MTERVQSLIFSADLAGDIASLARLVAAIRAIDLTHEDIQRVAAAVRNMDEALRRARQEGEQAVLEEARVRAHDEVEREMARLRMALRAAADDLKAAAGKARTPRQAEVISECERRARAQAEVSTP